MFHVKQKYDVVVVGAGHAGVEAATMASRLGMRATIVTKLVVQLFRAQERRLTETFINAI